LRAPSIHAMYFIEHIMKIFFTIALVILSACKSSAPASQPAAPVSPPAAGVRPSCEAIDEACDPHEDKPGLPHECHELSENAATTEADCAAKKDECLAACPKAAS
jgi:hypothetical protein